MSKLLNGLRAGVMLLKHGMKPTEAMVKFIPAEEAELKALGDIPDGYVAGWASTPDLDEYRHVIQPGAFDESIQTLGFTGPKGIKLLANHKWDIAIGVIKKLETRNGRLWIEAQLNLEMTRAKEIWQSAKSVGGMSFSVGFMLKDYSFKKDAAGYEYLEITKGDLMEVSVVLFPGNKEATMDFVKSMDNEAKNNVPTTMAAFEKMLVERGLAKSRNDAAKITLAVKDALALFQKEQDQPAPVVEPAPIPKPVLAKESIDQMMTLVAEMKKTLSGE